MGDWRRHFRAPYGGWAHPGAPAGGTGPGHSRIPGHHHWDSDRVPHPDSPAARGFDWSALSHIDVDDRAQAVLESIRAARRDAPAAILEATGEELGAIAEGVIPGLLMCLCIVAATTTLGGAAGMAIGALAAGIGAAPGAILGAGVGLEAGLALLQALGLAFLAAAIGSSLYEATKLAAQAVNEAWHAVDENRSRWFHVEHAGKTLASALGVLMRGVLQGIVAFLIAKGANAAASRVPELVAKLRASKLGEGFATWVERNWASLIKNQRLQQKPEPIAGGGSGGGPKSQTTGPSNGGRVANNQRRGPSSTAADESQGEMPRSAAKPKDQPLTADQKARARRIGKTAVANSKGSVRDGLAEVNGKNLSQGEALEALRAMYEPGRKIGEVVPDAGGNLVVLSRNSGKRQPVNIVDQDGKISFGKADIEQIDMESVKTRVAAEPDPQKKLEILNEPRKFSNVEKDEP